MPRLLTKLTFATMLASLLQVACGGDPLKRITVEMKWQRGAIGQQDRAFLHFQKGPVDCSLNFYSEQSVKYIETFGSAPVPVVFDVSYTSSGKPSGATLVRVGKWGANKFQPGERVLSTAQKLEFGKPGEARTFKIDSPGGCFESLPASIEVHFSAETTIFLLLLTANIGLVTVAFLYGGSEPSVEHPSRKGTTFGTGALALASGSQILFLAYALAGRFGWVRFYPGNPIQTYTILAGVILSAAAFVAGLFGTGLKRWAGLLVAVTTAGLWFLAAVASVAI